MGELAIIFGFVIIAALIAFGFGSSIHKRQIAYKERKDALERERSDANAPGTARTVAQLEKRVRVLERLATDRGQDLASQIEDLRSLPDVEIKTENQEKVQ